MVCLPTMPPHRVRCLVPSRFAAHLGTTSLGTRLMPLAT
jgi:hypothetical protein